MIEYLYTLEEIKLINYLKATSPKKIWLEPISVIFEYESFYFELTVLNAEKVKFKNSFDQFVMTTKLSKINSKFRNQELSILISQNEIISNINIVRTLLVFESLKKISDNYYEGSSFITNPINITNQDIINRYERIADIGLFVELKNGKCLNCFILENDEDFAMNQFMINDNLKIEKADLYQFLDL